MIETVQHNIGNTFHVIKGLRNQGCGGAAPLVWIWDPLISRKLLELKRWNFTHI